MQIIYVQILLVQLHRPDVENKIFPHSWYFLQGQNSLYWMIVVQIFYNLKCSETHKVL